MGFRPHAPSRIVLGYAHGLVLLLAGVTAANPRGRIGVSGEDGKFCIQCHSGAATPSLQLRGPTSLRAGERGSYTLTLQGGAAVVGGFNIAVGDPDATLVAGDDDSRLERGELTHSRPLPFARDGVTVSFDVVAPASGTWFELFAAGNSCNGDGTPQGDAASTSTLRVAITEGGGGFDTISGAGEGAGVGGGGPLPARTGCDLSRHAPPPGALSLGLAMLLLLRVARSRRR